MIDESIYFIKAPTYQDGHPIDSTPADEQNFLVNTINRLQSLPEWNSTAITITYDDYANAAALGRLTDSDYVYCVISVLVS